MTGDDTHARPRRSAGFRTGLLVVLLVALVGSAAAVAYLGATRPVTLLGFEVRDSRQDALQAEREQVMSQAGQFMLRINTYGPSQLQGDEMPAYRKLVEQVITPKFAADFEKNVPAAEATVKQASVARSAQVFSTGVSAIDADSATALVAGAFTQSYPETAGSTQRVQTDPSPFRVTVQLVRIHGTWLVDDFSPVVDDNDDSGSGSESPSPLPSPSPSVDPSSGTAPSSGASGGASR